MNDHQSVGTPRFRTALPGGGRQEEEEEGLFKADAVNEGEEVGGGRQEEEEEEGLSTADAVNEGEEGKLLFIRSLGQMLV